MPCDNYVSLWLKELTNFAISVEDASLEDIAKEMSSNEISSTEISSTDQLDAAKFCYLLNHVLLNISKNSDAYQMTKIKQ